MSVDISFISLGPGDPELITVKALARLQSADVIMVPSTIVSSGTARGCITSRAAEIIGHWQVDGEMRLFPIPMCHDPRCAIEVYTRMAVEVAELFRQGKRVVVAVEGDVSIYASIHYVMELLKTKDIPVEQVPGVTSFIAAVASEGLSLVSSKNGLTILPGRIDEQEMLHLLAEKHNIVVMKLSQCTHQIRSFICAHPGFSYHYFENVGTDRKFHTSNREIILNRDFPYFSILLVYADGTERLSPLSQA